ncbi:MAG: hypothetical protein R3Y47_09260 [Lachnospiraceae bacterium]
MKEVYWNKFLTSGSVADYLDYTSHNEIRAQKDSLHARGDEGSTHANVRRSNRDCNQSRTDWGI